MNTDCVGSKTRRVGFVDFDPLSRGDVAMNRRQGGWRKGWRIIDDAPTWQRAERGVEVIKTRLRQRQAEARDA
jgi:hypothetical protein